MASRLMDGALLFIAGLILAILIVDVGTDNAVLGFAVWFGSGALMGAGLLLPFRRAVLRAAVGVLFMGGWRSNVYI